MKKQYAAGFLKAIPATLEHEGGFNDIKADRGGATNWGISLRFLQNAKLDINNDGVVNWLDVKGLTKEQATDLYFTHFWPDYCNRLPPRVAAKVFDIGVNAGPGRAATILQRALVAAGQKIVIDGKPGPGTEAAAGRVNETDLLVSIAREQMLFYAGIIKADPGQLQFLAGWVNRAFYIPL